MAFNNPISSEKADRLVHLLELRAGARVLDAGCGTGEFLLRVVAHHGANGVGIDNDPECIAVAGKDAAARGLQARCEFHVADVNEFRSAPHSFDVAICIGSTHAFGAGDAAYPNTIRRFRELVRPGGYILIGEGYWKQPPAPEYQKLLGEPVGIYHDHAANIAFAEKRGLVPLYATVSNDDEWDHFEWSHQQKLRRQAEAISDDAKRAEMLSRARQWRDGYLRWGRSTMGFGFYLFQEPGKRRDKKKD